MFQFLAASRFRSIDSRGRPSGRVQTGILKARDDISWRPPEAPSQLKLEPQHFGSSGVEPVCRNTSELKDAWRAKKLADLCSYFEHHDHVQRRNQLATMTGTVAAAVARHGDSGRNILEINRVYYKLRRNLWTHMLPLDQMLLRRPGRLANLDLGKNRSGDFDAK